MKKSNYLTLFFDDEPKDTGGATADKPADSNAKPGNTDSKSGNKTEDKTITDEKSEKKYSDEDLDRIISKKFEKWQKQQAAAVDEATKLANMNAQERAEHERDKLKAELESLKKANVRAEMEKTARGILKTDGVNVPDEIVACLVADDADKTSETVKAFSKAFKVAVQEEVKAQLSHKSPVAGTAGKGITKADIFKETDPLKRQQMISQNMNLFANGKK